MKECRIPLNKPAGKGACARPPNDADDDVSEAFSYLKYLTELNCQNLPRISGISLSVLRSNGIKLRKLYAKDSFALVSDHVSKIMSDKVEEFEFSSMISSLFEVVCSGKCLTRLVLSGNNMFVGEYTLSKEDWGNLGRITSTLKHLAVETIKGIDDEYLGVPKEMCYSRIIESRRYEHVRSFSIL